MRSGEAPQSGGFEKNLVWTVEIPGAVKNALWITRVGQNGPRGESSGEAPQAGAGLGRE